MSTWTLRDCYARGGLLGFPKFRRGLGCKGVGFKGLGMIGFIGSEGFMPRSREP